MKSSVVVIGFLLTFCAGFTQEPGMRNYTTHDGLPSDEVYKSLLASNGYIWFATNDGVCFFDGENFTSFDMDDGLSENTILGLEEDKEGRIWFTGLSGRLSYYQNGEIFLFEGNDVITKRKTSADIPCAGHLTPIGLNEIKIGLFSGKLLHIKNGKSKISTLKNDSFPISKQDDNYRFYIEHINDSVKYSVIFDSIKRSASFKSPLNWAHYSNYYLYLEYADKIIYFLPNTAFTICRNGEVIIEKMPFTAMYALKDLYGGIWIGTYKNGIVFYPDGNFNQPPKIHFLKDQFITSLQYDKSERGWATTSFGGVFHIQSLNINNYYLKGRHLENYITKSLQLDTNTFVFFSRNNTAYLTDDFHNPMQKIIIPELGKRKVYQAKLYGEKVYLSTNDNFIEIPLEFFTNPKRPKKGIKAYKISCIKDFVFQDSVLWLATCGGVDYDANFLKTNLLNPTEVTKFSNRANRVIPYEPSSTHPNDSIYSYLLFQDLQTLSRLRYEKSNPGKTSLSSYSNPVGEQAVLSNDMVIREKDDAIFIAAKGLGLQIIIGDSSFSLNESDGLLSNSINVLKFQSHNTLVAGTNKGLNIIELSMDKYPSIISSSFISTKDGLKGNEIHDISIKGQHVIVSTNRGVSLLNISQILKMRDVFPIYISDFLVNGSKRNIDEHKLIKFDPLENNIQINYDAIDLHDKSGMTYYYRLLGSGDDLWQKTGESSVLFPILAAGIYNFQVKAINSYGFKSESTVSIFFEIDEVYFKTLWFRLFIVLFAGGLIVFGFFYVFFRRNEKLRNDRVLAEFQQQSLARTMNPHFIFNVLNSINSFIISGNKKDATFYINQIATLIRQIFYTAHEKKILIKEEGELLNTYLKLEQRRTKNIFNFIVKVDKELDNISIPPFMIQIFVENSIWHGLSDAKGRGGLISVLFKKIGEYIYCEILDNGIGRQASIESGKEKSEKPNKYEKHGIDVIKKRIELLNTRKQSKKITLDIIDLVVEMSGEVQGTRVLLKFPINIKE